MKTMFASVAALSFASLVLAAEKGAKALFVDTTSGATVRSTATKPDVRKIATNRRKPSTSVRQPEPPPTTAGAAPEVSGLMYYVELVSPNGETSRVTTDRTFMSGERILLHVVSAVDGDVAVYQRTPNGQAVRLFPDDRIRNGNSWIAKGVDTALPSASSWFRFDEQPGTEELTVVLTPRQAEGVAPHPAPVPQLAVARYDDLSSAGGSKGLVVETDNAGPAPATYVVRRAAGGRPPEPIVVTIRLKHR